MTRDEVLDALEPHGLGQAELEAILVFFQTRRNGSAVLPLQRHLQDMLFYHKDLRRHKTPLLFVACARNAAILHGQIWSVHKSDVVGLHSVHGQLANLDIRLVVPPRTHALHQLKALLREVSDHDNSGLS